MKAILITFDQAFYEKIVEMLERNSCRGFTYWENVQGRGSETGEPHFGSHAWPSMNSAILTVVDDRRVDTVLELLHEMDLNKPKLGLRAFVWDLARAI
ncbi:MAG: hypothetical protein IJ835_07355 [Muribaculaceae bacterium]|nr:hypothetical protein [Muribaculaceae bacterium]